MQGNFRAPPLRRQERIRKRQREARQETMSDNRVRDDDLEENTFAQFVARSVVHVDVENIDLI